MKVLWGYLRLYLYESESRSVVSNPLRPHGILQARILEWVAFPFPRGSSQPRDQTQVFHIAGGFLTSWATRKALTSSVDEYLRTFFLVTCFFFFFWFVFSHEISRAEVCSSLSLDRKNLCGLFLGETSSKVAQMVKRLPTMLETQVQSLG